MHQKLNSDYIYVKVYYYIVGVWTGKIYAIKLTSLISNILFAFKAYCIW